MFDECPHSPAFRPIGREYHVRGNDWGFEVGEYPNEPASSDVLRYLIGSRADDALPAQRGVDSSCLMIQAHPGTNTNGTRAGSALSRDAEGPKLSVTICVQPDTGMTIEVMQRHRCIAIGQVIGGRAKQNAHLTNLDRAQR